MNYYYKINSPNGESYIKTNIPRDAFIEEYTKQEFKQLTDNINIQKKQELDNYLNTALPIKEQNIRIHNKLREIALNDLGETDLLEWKKY